MMHIAVNLSLFLSGERFTANDAHRIGLIHESVDNDCLDEVVEKTIKQLLSGGPVAQSEIKTLLRGFSPIDHDLKTKTAKLIAKLRTSPEGQEGIAAFLEKRKAAWID